MKFIEFKNIVIMNKQLNYILIGILVFTSVFMGCSDIPTYEEREVQNNELILKAKELIQAKGNMVSLSVSGTGRVESRSGLSMFTEATPQWESAKYYKQGGIQILMIELKTVEDVISRITTTKDGVEDTQETTTFSRLVIRKKGDDIYAHVLTYMPESNYAVANKEQLDTMGYYPQNIDFTGVTISSYLDGTVCCGIRYDNGKIVGLLTKYKPTECSHEHHEGEACTHNHNTGDNIVNINLYSRAAVCNQSRGGDDDKCIICGNKLVNNKCTNCNIGYGAYCSQCHWEAVVDGVCLYCGYIESKECPECDNNPCTCDENNDDRNKCPICGTSLSENDYTNGHTCFPDYCTICGKEECTCDPILPVPDTPTPTPIDTCDICLTYPCKCCDNCRTFPCECVINTTPIEYVVHEGDWIVGESESISVTTFCPMAVLEMAHKALGGTGMTQEMFTQYYTQINVMSPNEETVLEYNDGFMNQFFSTSSTADISDDIELGNVVVIRRNGHYLLAFGLQYDGDLIYADLHEGKLYAVNESYFANCDYFTIDDLSSGGKSRKIE